MITLLDQAHIAKQYENSKNRLLLLDYDGTLVPFNDKPHETSPSGQVRFLLSSLGLDSNNKVVLISGRDMDYLDSHFSQIPITLVAEHGAYCKNPGEAWTGIHEGRKNMAWLDEAGKALQALTFEFEGSFVEWKNFSVAWHYRTLKTPLSSIEKEQILLALRNVQRKQHFIITDSHYTIELRTPGVGKDAYLRKYYNPTNALPFDFVMAVGDSPTDEDLFQQLGPNSFTIKVGADDQSAANYFVESQSAVLQLLEQLNRATSSVNTFNYTWSDRFQ